MSAKYGHGVEDVKDWILSKLPVGPAYYPKVLWCQVIYSLFSSFAYGSHPRDIK